MKSPNGRHTRDEEYSHNAKHDGEPDYGSAGFTIGLAVIILTVIGIAIALAIP